jgi:hypothetical protein
MIHTNDQVPIPIIKKFHCMMSSLGAQGSTSLKHLPVMEYNYHVAWSLLQE